MIRPLGPEDVPPGTAIRSSNWPKGSWRIIQEVESYYIWFEGCGKIPHRLRFEELQSGGWQISRDAGKTWGRCEKELTE